MSAVILITGCSTGLGRELALAALSAGLRTLASLQDQGAKALKLDVTACAEDLKAFAAQAVASFGQIDYLVNNAGFVQGGAIEENTPEENLAQFNTNFFGVINVTSALLPHFRARKQGTIVNISSQGSALCIPGAGVYCASKGAVDTITDTWAHELAKFNIRCTSIQAGAYRTSVAESGNLKIAANKIDGYEGAHEWIETFNKSAGTERGDVRIAASKIIELISVDPGRPLPMRLALGEDAYESMKAFHARELENLEKWKSFITGTDVVG
ncbi:3-oxoacyl-reductase [Mycena sp. CBHHK59/15]|nr:3-oxoacyl-reductase [Mycena sp. CBHHK59/15]